VFSCVDVKTVIQTNMNSKWRRFKQSDPAQVSGSSIQTPMP